MQETSTKLLKELSVFFPCYNEQDNIKNTVESAIKVLNSVSEKWEIIIVNDGSKDKTLEVCEKIQEKYPKQIKIINHNVNQGYGAAFKSGLFACSYEWITFTDSDGQFDFKELTKLLEKQKKDNVDVVVGYRIKRNDPPIRILIAKMLKIWNYLFFGFSGIRDVDCAFKLFKKAAIDNVKPLKTSSAITTTELLIKLKRAGYKISQVGVNHYPRRFGSQTGSNFKVIKKAAIDSINLYRAINTK